MGQVPPKYFLPSSPYGSSPAANALNPNQPAAQNAQTPLLPPNWTDPGTLPTIQNTAPTNAGSVLGSKLGQPGNLPKMYGSLYGL
jgi:hypothetical protein